MTFSKRLLRGRGLITAILAGAMATGLISQVEEYLVIRKDEKDFAKLLGGLSSEEQQMLTLGNEARERLAKKLEPVIGKNPLDSFLKNTALSTDPLFDPKVKNGWEKVKDYQERFDKEAQKRFPTEWRELNNLQARRVQRTLEIVQRDRGASGAIKKQERGEP